MVNVPILVRSMVVLLVRLSKANDIALSSDLVDYIHTPLPNPEEEENQSFSLDWWNNTPLPSGLETPARWMTLDTMGKCHKRDKIPQWPPKSYDVPRRMSHLFDQENPCNTRPLTEGYCRTCCRLLEFVRHLQQELKSVRNTYRGWVTISRHRAVQAQLRASGLYGILEALAKKEATTGIVLGKQRLPLPDPPSNRPTVPPPLPVPPSNRPTVPRPLPVPPSNRPTVPGPLPGPSIEPTEGASVPPRRRTGQ